MNETNEIGGFFKEFNDFELKCVKCGTKIYGLGDDYHCPNCNGLFCYYHIKKHACKDIETYSVGNKHNFTRIKGEKSNGD